jgi:rubrerythrin
MPRTIYHDDHAAHLDTHILRIDRRNNFNWCENCRGWFEPISMNATELTAIEVQAIDIHAATGNPSSLARAGFRFQVEAIACDPEDTGKAASMFVCACYNKEVAEMIACALRDSAILQRSHRLVTHTPQRNELGAWMCPASGEFFDTPGRCPHCGAELLQDKP